MFKKTPISLYTLLIFISFNFITGVMQANGAEYRIRSTQRPYKIDNRTYYPLPSAHGYIEEGIASWYGEDFHGRATSNGETYNMHDITAAHKLLPMHTMLLVENLDNGKKTVVRVNDRGPFVKGRIIDLSYGSAKKVGLVGPGTANVKITALGEVKKSGPGGRFKFEKQADLYTGNYFVQIGAFIKKYNAVNLQDRFLDAGHQTVIREETISGKTYFRVQVYVGQSLDGARMSERALLNKGYKGAFIIAS